MEGARRQGAALRLVRHRLENAGVPMTLVHRGVGRQAIEVFAPLRIPDLDAFGLGDHHRQRVVVVGAVLLVQRDDFLGAQALARLGHGLSPFVSARHAMIRPYVATTISEFYNYCKSCTNTIITRDTASSTCMYVMLVGSVSSRE